jgi:hypothetical protein
LAISGYVGEGSSSVTAPIKTDLGPYIINFNLTSKYDYEIGSLSSEKTPGSSYLGLPAYTWYTRRIDDLNDMVRGVTISISVYDEPMNTSTLVIG